jgi:Ca2+-binding EF-hand superfamily protein
LDGIIEAIFASADANSDGRICFDEFIKVFGATHCHPS